MKPIGAFDIETDPFKADRIPRPFAADFFDGERHFTFWGKDCVARCWALMRKFDGYIYAHNGGKFDFHYLLEDIPGTALHDIKLIKSRIAVVRAGLAEFRDSWLLVPTALRAFAKVDIDYRKLEKNVRDRHREEILRYLRSDTENLLAYIQAMIAENGFGLTIAGRTFAQLKEKFDMKPPRTSERYDARFRRFYFGGRVEFFKLGVLPGPWQMVDINSAYPRAMKEEHPFDPHFETRDRLPRRREELRACFALVDATSKGALPVRLESGGVEFPHTRGKFFATGWEIEAGRDLGLLEIHETRKVYYFTGRKSFSRYVDYYYRARLEAKARGDRTADLLNKLVLNSLYGRFALNPREFNDVKLFPTGKSPDDKEGWEIALEMENGLSLWRRKHELRGNDFFNVATAASITGWVRAYMLRALHAVREPIYCDTDSIVCRDLGKLAIGGELGEWKVEAQDAPQMAIAGKKLYALKLADGKFKTAAKGVRLSPQDIIAVARGEARKFKFESPNFSLISPVGFVERTVRRDDQRLRKGTK